MRRQVAGRPAVSKGSADLYTTLIVNIRAAFLLHGADAPGSVAVIIAGTLVLLFGWARVEPDTDPAQLRKSLKEHSAEAFHQHTPRWNWRQKMINARMRGGLGTSRKQLKMVRTCRRFTHW